MQKGDRIENCVCYFRLALQRPDGTIAPVHLNLLRIYLEKRDEWSLKYDPQQFGSANIGIGCMSLGYKKVAALIFSTGKVVCPGPSSPRSGLIMAHLITGEVSRVLGAPFCMRDFQIPNMVGKVHTHPVDIATMAEILGDSKARYEPVGLHPFPACFVFPHKDLPVPDKVVYLVFKSGKVVITGCRSEADVIKNMAEVRELCSYYPQRGLSAANEMPSALLAADRAMIGGPGLSARSRLAIEPARPVFSTGISYSVEFRKRKRKRIE